MTKQYLSSVCFLTEHEWNWKLISHYFGNIIGSHQKPDEIVFSADPQGTVCQPQGLFKSTSVSHNRPVDTEMKISSRAQSQGHILHIHPSTGL